MYIPFVHSWQNPRRRLCAMVTARSFLRRIYRRYLKTYMFWGGQRCNYHNTRWFKYDRDYLCVNKSQFVPVIFEPPCTTYMPRRHYGCLKEMTGVVHLPASCIWFLLDKLLKQGMQNTYTTNIYKRKHNNANKSVIHFTYNKGNTKQTRRACIKLRSIHHNT